MNYISIDTYKITDLTISLLDTDKCAPFSCSIYLLIGKVVYLAPQGLRSIPGNVL